MNISQAGIDLIKQSEGFVAHIYNDVAGKPTIGFGHLLKSTDHMTTISADDAEILLRADVAGAEHAVNALITAPMTQGQFDALVDFAFNLGNGALAASTLRKLMNCGKIVAAANEFEKWVFAGGVKQPGLITRRAAEKALFLA